MSDNAIVFIDSGVGGLPYLEMTKEFLPEQNFVYVADNKNFPYGEKNSKELTKIIIRLIESIVERLNPVLIVIACNTASVVALSTLRTKFGIPFVGVVPAIKPAVEYSGKGSIGLLATRKTIEDPYTDELIKKFASGCIVKKYAGIDLVEFVEKKYFISSDKEKLQIVSEASNYFTDNNIDSLILGCTHFIHLAEYFKEILGNSVDIIDSRQGVVKQIIRLIKNDKVLPVAKKRDIFYMTGDGIEKKNYMKFADKFDLFWGGNL